MADTHSRQFIPSVYIEGMERILQFIRDAKKPYVTISDSDRPPSNDSSGRVIQFTNCDIPEETVDNLVSRVKIFLEGFTNGYVGYMHLKDTSGTTNGGIKMAIKISNSNPVSGIGAINQQPAVNIQEEVQKAINAYKTELEIEQLKKEIKEKDQIIKDNQLGPIDRVVERLEPYMPLLVKGIFGIDMDTQSITQNVIGKANNSQSETDAEKEKVVIDSLNVLADGEPDVHLLLAKLAELKKNSPAKYAMAKSML